MFEPTPVLLAFLIFKRFVFLELVAALATGLSTCFFSSLVSGQLRCSLDIRPGLSILAKMSIPASYAGAAWSQVPSIAGPEKWQARKNLGG